MYDFERTTAFVILSDPVTRKIKNNKGGTTAEVSGVHSGGRGGAAQGGTSGSDKVSKGMTGVELRFHKKSEYNKLTHEEKGELKRWYKKVKCKNSNQNREGGDSNSQNKNHKQLISALNSCFDKIEAAIVGLTGDSLDDDELSMDLEPVKKTGKRKKIAMTSPVRAKVGKSSLHEILKKVNTEKDK
eukprot:12086369-Ditylum_brightwellii.AAC.1